ncbi:MAG: hypothetical protein ACRDBM_07775 [Sporomusa sp.]
MFSLSKRQAVILLGVIILVILAARLGWQYYSNTEAKLRQATVLTEQQAEDINVLQNELIISQGNAEALQAAYEQEKNKPATTFYVQATTLPAAAEQVQERINNNDQTLPPMVLEDSDRTVVVANETDYKVDVLKINLDKARFGVNGIVLAGNGTEAGAGPSWKNREMLLMLVLRIRRGHMVCGLGIGNDEK